MNPPRAFARLALGGAALLLGRALIRHRRTWELRGRTILVTGGSRGLGFLVARELLREGARVAICARDADTLARAQRQLEGDGGPVVAIPCDVAVREDIERVVGRVTEELGPIDALINNAGTITVGPLNTMRLADFHDAMNTNLWGALHAILAVLPDMRRRHAGRIVNIASIGGKLAVPHLLPYSASKFALVGLSEGLHAELARDGIQVTTICPGLMRTGSPRHAFFKGRYRAEYAWFSISDSLPLVSMDAPRAARQIVDALRWGEAGRVLGVPAKLGATAHALFPGMTTALLALVNRALPDADGNAPPIPTEGEDSTSFVSPSLLTRLGDRAAEQHNQLG
jgi:NAD(P)-dependent dehydrogenase (short-subunit alcohol dehydrogenase family)